MPSIFAGPYLHLEPELAFVLDNGRRAVGYILGTRDTAAFVDAYRREWLPRIAGRYPPPAGPPTEPSAGPTEPPATPPTPSDELVRLMHAPEYMIRPELAGYPAHLHIDVLPEYQRAGHGRALLSTFLAALRAAGAPAVHLGMVSANTAARAFYDRMGFHEIPVDAAGPTTYLGRRTTGV